MTPTQESAVHAHSPRQKGDLFSAWDSGSTEVEYLNVLTALVCAMKPDLVLETGTYRGWGTIALARGCVLNTFGRVITLDRMDCLGLVQMRMLDAGVHQDTVSIVRTETVDWLRQRAEYRRLHPECPRFGFAFLDSDHSVRAQELAILLDNDLMEPDCCICIHDSSPFDEQRHDAVWKMNRHVEHILDGHGRIRQHGKPIIGMNYLPLSRGLTVITRVGV